MAKKRANGEGNIRKRADGRWEGRYTAGYNAETGKRIIKNVLGKTQAECKAKLAAAMEATKGVDVSRADEYTVATWLRSWYDIYAGPLRCGLHPAHLHPRYKAEARRGRTNDGQFYGTGDVSQSKKDERTEYPSAHLLPIPRISACGSRCGSGGCLAFCPTPESAFLQQKSTENRSFRCFLSCCTTVDFEPPAQKSHAQVGILRSFLTFLKLF